jgi:hypothetical protein
MSEHLQVVFDIVTRKASYRFTQLERPPAGLLIPPGLSNMPASVVRSRPEGLLILDVSAQRTCLVPELDLDVSHQDLASEPEVSESELSLANEVVPAR